MNDNAIDVQDLVLSFKNFKVLRGLNLKVRSGSAMALLGENGAGKTTTLRALVNIYEPDSVKGEILGHELGFDGAELFQKIGYVSENQALPYHWTMTRLLNYLRPQYPTWDQEFCETLLEEFELPMNRKIGHFSRGMMMKASLVSSMAYRPELLILDEPFSGLDVLVREELIDAILDLMDGGDWTILLSSHDVHEVERLCDSVTVLDRGQATISESLDSMQSRFRRCHVTVKSPIEISQFPEDWLLLEQLGERNWSFVETQYQEDKSPERWVEVFGELEGEESQSLSLKEIYLTLAKQKKRIRKAARKLAAMA